MLSEKYRSPFTWALFCRVKFLDSAVGGYLWKNPPQAIIHVREQKALSFYILALRPTSVANSFQDNSARWGAKKFCRLEIKIRTYKKLSCFIQMRPICLIFNHFSESMKSPVVHAFVREK
jgi:hypothetical protein